MNAQAEPATEPTPIVAMEGVTRRYGEVTAVDNLSLTVEQGETVALLGPNGAGKTTATEMLLGLTKPDSGDIRLFGREPQAAVAEGGVGAMLQDADIPNGATVTELIELIRSLYPDPLSLGDTLGISDLEEVADRQVQRLSGGQRQRVRLALALAGNPGLLVLDEPTAALDVEARRAFWDRTRAYVSAGRGLLFATHRLEEAEAIADRVVVIANGRLVADGTPQQVKGGVPGRSAVSFSADGRSPEELKDLAAVEEVEAHRGRLILYTSDADDTVRALLEQGPPIEGLEITRAGMEEAFLSLTKKEES